VNEVQRLALELAKLKRKVDGLGGPQLAYSSLEDGYVNEYDADGQLSSVIGRQYDGTHGVVTVAGPRPPTPAGITAEPVPTGVLVTWSGEWEPLPPPSPGFMPTPQVAPLDFSLAEVHASTDPNFSAVLFTTKRGEILSPRGGEVIVPVSPDVEVYVRLVARTSSGKASLASSTIGPVTGGLVPRTAVDIDFEAIGGNTIYRQVSPPSGTHKIGNLWLELPDNVAHRWEGELEGWVETRDQGVAKALQDAFDANAAAEQAGLAALAAQGTAGTAQEAAEAAQEAANAANLLAGQAKGTADSKITVYRQATAPTGGTYKVNGDLWIDRDTGLVYYASTTSGDWLPTPDQRIATALTNAGTANSAAAAAQAAADRAMRAAVNVISDPSFENGVITPGSSWAIDSTVSRTGSKSLLAPTAGVSGNPTTLATSVPVLPGQVWRARIYCRSTPDYNGNGDNGKFRLQGNARSGGTHAILTVPWGAGDGTTWVLKEILYTVPADGSIVSLNLTAVRNHTAGQLWLDDVELTNITEAKAAADAAAAAATAAGNAQSTANTKITVFVQASPPALTGRTVGDLWLDSDDGNKRYVWTGSWAEATDAQVTAAATLAGAANTLAGQAKSAADSKITVYRQSTAPSGGTYKVNGDLWIDSDDGKLYYASTATGGWLEASDQRIAEALTAGTNAGTAASAAQARADAALLAQTGVSNPIFAQWSNPYPDGFTAWSAGVINSTIFKETSTKRTSPNSVRMVVGSTTAQVGMQMTSAFTTGLARDTEYVAVELDVMLTAGTFGQAGVILDYPDSNRQLLNLATEVPTPVLNQWYRITKVVKRGTTVTPTTGTFGGYLMAQWNGHAGGGAVKTIVYDRFSLRPATAQEIQAYNSATAASVTSLTTVVGTKTTVFAQTSQPSTTGRTVGDIWLDTDDGNTVYDWSGTWTKRQLGATAISATARQLGAITTFRQATAPATGMIVGDFWIDSDDNQIYRYEGTTPTWVASRDTAINTAITNAATAQSTADGKMRIFPQASAPTGLAAADVGDMWIDTDDGNKSYTWDLVSGTTYGWVARQLGNSAIQPQSLVLSDLAVTGSVTAALLESVLVLATTIIAGNPNGTHARMTSNGFYTYQPNPIAGQPPIEATRMGTSSDDYISVVGADGKVKGGFDLGGRVTASGGTIGGDPVLGGLKLSDHLAQRSKGMEGWGAAGNPSARSTGAELGFYEVLIPLENGRVYTINTSHMRMTGSVDGQVGQVNIRYTSAAGLTTPAVPQITSAFLTRVFVQMPYGIAGAVAPIRKLLFTPAGTGVTTYRFLLTHQRVQGTGDVYMDNSVADPIELWAEDLGPAIGSTLSPNNGGGGTQPAPKTRYDQTFASTWTRTWRGNGTVFADDGAGAWQGSIGDGNGNMYSLIGFQSDIASRLSGATIEAIQVYLYAEHWWYNQGGLAYIGSHGHIDRPAAVTQAQYGNIAGDLAFERGGARWVNIPPAHFASWANGTFRGITLGPSPAAGNLNYYGRFAGGNASLIRLVFSK
jgi:hypothetical protein